MARGPLPDINAAPASLTAEDAEASIARISNAVLALGHRRALDGVSLTLRKGEIYVLLGPNGAGKTSLLRALCGRLPLDSGTVTVGEPPRDPRAHPEVRRLIGLVPQDVAMYPRLTVRENIEVFEQLAGLRRSRDRIDSVLRVTQLTAMSERLGSRLSGGFQRRLNIAIALVTGPKLLLLDEPTVGLDLQARGAIHEMLMQLRDTGIAILLVTHDFDQAERLADRIGIIAHGRAVCEGCPEHLLRQAFGASRQVEVILTDLPAPLAEAKLRAFGLRPVDGPLVWTALMEGSAQQASKLLDGLRADDIGLREIRIREPGLDTLFRQVVTGVEP